MPETFSRRKFLVQGGRAVVAGGAIAAAGPLLSACDWFAKSGPTSATEVAYTYPTFTPVPDVALVQDAMNKILKPKYGVTIKLNPIDFGAYDQKQKLAVAAGDVQDIVYSVPWVNNYYVNVAQGALKPLDGLLKSHAPKTYASMTVQAWQATKVNGKIYGVLDQQPWTRPIGPRVRKDLADKYGLDLTKVSTFDDLTPFLAAVKAGEPKVTPIGIAQIPDKRGPHSPPYLPYELLHPTSPHAALTPLN